MTNERRKLVADLRAVANEDEERQKLCKILRTMEPWPCKEAANEIERLEKEIETLKAQQREVRTPFHFGTEYVQAVGNTDCVEQTLQDVNNRLGRKP